MPTFRIVSTGILVAVGGLSCSAPATKPVGPTQPGSGVQTETDDTAGGDSAEGGSAGGETGLPAPASCPEGMVGIPPEAPDFCIDRYEASWTEAGDAVQSVAGVLPIANISFEQARALCEATPVMVDGEIIGHRRLASLVEWRDAADGVRGEGGSRFPTGDTWPEGQCALLDADGNPTTDGLVPTGSMPDCTGEFGLYDQLGNTWEWTDPNLLVGVEQFVQRRADKGLEITIDEVGAVFVQSGEPSSLVVEVHGLHGTVGVDPDDHRLMLTSLSISELDSDHEGYLVDLIDLGGLHTGSVLPVKVDVGASDGSSAPVVVRLEADGSPLTAKVGCAWYFGDETSCAIKNWFFAHPHDFIGTIGLRCSADPLP